MVRYSLSRHHSISGTGCQLYTNIHIPSRLVTLPDTTARLAIILVDTSSRFGISLDTHSAVDIPADKCSQLVNLFYF